MGHENLHEPAADLSVATLNLHRAIISLIEELEAVDWYNQRHDVCRDVELKALLAHNRDEEKEHAAMLLEWIRRQDQGFARELKEYLFTDRPLVEMEQTNRQGGTS